MVLSTMRVYDELIGSGMPDAQARAVVRIVERRAEAQAARRLAPIAGHQAEIRFYKAVVGLCAVALVAGNVALWTMALCT